MTNEVSKSERLAKIIAELCEGKQTVLAEKLGKSQQNMNMILKKGTWYDACALAEAFPELNEKWVLTGEGEMMKEMNANA